MLLGTESKPFGSTPLKTTLVNLSQEEETKAREEINCEYLIRETFRCGSSTYDGLCMKQDKSLCPAYQFEKMLEQKDQKGQPSEPERPRQNWRMSLRSKV